MNKLFIGIAVVLGIIVLYTVQVHRSQTTLETSPLALASVEATASASVGANASPSALVSPTPMTSDQQKTPDLIKAKILIAGKGEIDLDLYPKVAPKTVASFVKLATTGFYDKVKFHRVVADFVIQAGDPLSKTDDPMVGTGGPGYKFDDEINPKSLGLSADAIAQLIAHGYTPDYSLTSLPVTVGALAMANSGPNTNGSQFFIVTTKDQPSLNGMYTVFGKVTKGMDVVLKVAQGDVITHIQISQ